MSNEKQFLVVGNTYNFIATIGAEQPRAILGVYNGFQVIGGTTFFGFTYQNKTGKFEDSYIANAYHVYGIESTTAATAQKSPPQGVAATVAKAEPIVTVSATPVTGEIPVKRGRGRPKKFVAPTTGTTAVAASTENSEPKKRGRPRKNPEVVAAVVAAPLDPSGVPAPRKRGRPRKDAAQPPHMVAATVTIPPNIPTPSIVEEVDEIEDRDTVTASPKEKEVRAAVAPSTEAPAVVVKAADDDDASPVIAISVDDNDEVVPARTRMAMAGSAQVNVPTRPASSLARANRVPEEMDGDL